MRRVLLSLILSVVFKPVFAAEGKLFLSTSPDGLNELRLNVAKDGMVYSVLRRGKVVVEPTGIALKVEGNRLIESKTETSISVFLKGIP